jgi:ribosomal protein S18 acetylase RimI-like enzyme
MLPDLLRKARTAIRLLRTDRRQLLRTLLGRACIYRVFAARLDEIPPPEPDSSKTICALSQEELAAIVSRHQDLDYQLERVEEIGLSRAYGVFSCGQLAHICWLMTEREDRRFKIRLVKLRPAEAEITSAFTFPEFRGRGVYQFAIHSMCAAARARGLQRVFMITRRENEASQRGIRKAGLKYHGWILWIVPPLFWSGRGLSLRGFRLNRVP